MVFIPCGVHKHTIQCSDQQEVLIPGLSVLCHVTGSTFNLAMSVGMTVPRTAHRTAIQIKLVPNSHISVFLSCRPHNLSKLLIYYLVSSLVLAVAIFLCLNKKIIHINYPIMMAGSTYRLLDGTLSIITINDCIISIHPLWIHTIITFNVHIKKKSIRIDYLIMMAGPTDGLLNGLKIPTIDGCTEGEIDKWTVCAIDG